MRKQFARFFSFIHKWIPDVVGYSRHGGIVLASSILILHILVSILGGLRRRSWRGFRFSRHSFCVLYRIYSGLCSYRWFLMVSPSGIRRELHHAFPKFGPLLVSSYSSFSYLYTRSLILKQLRAQESLRIPKWLNKWCGRYRPVDSQKPRASSTRRFLLVSFSIEQLRTQLAHDPVSKNMRCNAKEEKKKKKNVVSPWKDYHFI